MTGQMATEGSIPTGPSDAYLRLLKGQITPEDYAKGVKKRVSAQRENGNSGRSGKTAVRRKSA